MDDSATVEKEFELRLQRVEFTRVVRDDQPQA